VWVDSPTAEEVSIRMIKATKMVTPKTIPEKSRELDMRNESRPIYDEKCVRRKGSQGCECYD
jgi:hypothetical protein